MLKYFLYLWKKNMCHINRDLSKHRLHTTKYEDLCM